jgi:hypothetical protein
MNYEPLKFQPLARTEGMVIKEVDDEVLVYDLKRDKAHCLNSAAAAVWRLCDGKTSVSEIARALENAADKMNENVIWVGLQDLHRNHLLENDSWPQIPLTKNMSRREAIRRIGMGAAIGLPLVISITAPTPVQAAVSCGARCKPCSTGSECCSGVCVTDPSGCNPGTRRCA